MEQFINKNMKDSIESLELGQGTAKESGNPYFYVTLTFINGFQKRFYMNDGERFAIQNAFEVAELGEQLDKD